MSTSRYPPPPRVRRELADITRKLSDLETMTVGELAAKYQELFGQPSRSRNKGYLRKQVAWRIQELAEGGLSEKAKRRIAELAPEAEALLRSMGNKGRRRGTETPPAKYGISHERDPRLPPTGTILRRIFQGREYSVKVLDEGFEFEGSVYRSLSQVAREIAGTRWNGFTFFGLKNGDTTSE